MLRLPPISALLPQEPSTISPIQHGSSRSLSLPLQLAPRGSIDRFPSAPASSLGHSHYYERGLTNRTPHVSVKVVLPSERVAPTPRSVCYVSLPSSTPSESHHRERSLILQSHLYTPANSFTSYETPMRSAGIQMTVGVTPLESPHQSPTTSTQAQHIATYPQDHQYKQQSTTTAQSTTSRVTTEKTHNAQLFLAPPTSGTIRATRSQLRILLKIFSENPMPSGSLHNAIAERIGMSRNTVRNWFQNQRAKIRRIEQDKLANAKKTLHTNDIPLSTALLAETEPGDEKHSSQVGTPQSYQPESSPQLEARLGGRKMDINSLI